MLNGLGMIFVATHHIYSWDASNDASLLFRLLGSIYILTRAKIFMFNVS